MILFPQRRHLLTIFLGPLLLVVAPIAAQQAQEAPAPAPSAASPQSAPPEIVPAPQISTPPPTAPEKKRPFHVELGGSLNWLNNNYGTWKSFDAKLAYTGSKRVSPFLLFSSQTRDQGSQQSYGLGTYVTINNRFYSILGIGGAPDRGTVLYPQLRLDAALLGGVPKVPGLVMSVGISDFHYSNPGGGQIYSVGSIYYHRKLILSGSVNFNRDRVSGVFSESAQFGFMYGAQGKYWFGGGMSGGKEAYQILSAIPFDVRFNNVSPNVFFQKWLTRYQGFMIRYDYQDKLTAFQRHAISGFLFCDF